MGKLSNAWREIQNKEESGMKRFPRDEKDVLYHEVGDGRTLIVQPHGSAICGQCAMAMITGEKLETIIDKTELHPKGGTSISGRDKVLEQYMAEVATDWEIDNRKPIDISGTGILCLQYGRSMTGHAVAFIDGKIYDPAGRVYSNIKEMREHYKARNRKIRVHAVTYTTPYEAPMMAAASDTTE